MNWGSSDPKHGQVLQAVAIKPDRRRRGCVFCQRMGVASVVTHHGRANGVTLMSVCEWHARAWAKKRGGS